MSNRAPDVRLKEGVKGIVSHYLHYSEGNEEAQERWEDAYERAKQTLAEYERSTHS